MSVFDLPKLAPSLRLDTGLSSAKARLTIRGIGTAGGSALEPSVATFVNGIYIPREGATVGAYYDIAAVEVLRGPQGTLRSEEHTSELQSLMRISDAVFCLKKNK